MDLCALNMADKVRLALKNGASPHAPSVEDTKYGDGSTPLMVSVINNRNGEVSRLLLEAGADPNRENSVGRAPLDEAQSTEMLDILQAAGAWLVGKNTYGVLRARGLDSLTAFSETRFFQVADSTHNKSTHKASESAKEEALTPLQQRVFAFVAQNIQLEIPATADISQRLGYSSQYVFISDDGTGEPIANLLHHIKFENSGFVLGRSHSDGTSIRIYSAKEGAVYMENGEQLVSTTAAALQPPTDSSGETSAHGLTFYGERVCFVDPKTHLPVPAYPYYILTDKGVAIAGKTQEEGCSAELFVPAPSAHFRVFGGADALQMDMLSPNNAALSAP